MASTASSTIHIRVDTSRFTEALTNAAASLQALGTAIEPTGNTWQGWLADSGGTTGSTWHTWVDSGATVGSFNSHASYSWYECRYPLQTSPPTPNKEKEGAEKRARELLLSVLDGGQKKAYGKDRKFPVVGSNGGRYMLSDHATAELGGDGKVVARFCIHSERSWEVPLADQILARKLLLEADEDEFLRIANRSLVR